MMQFDVAVLGDSEDGRNMATRCARAGMSVALITGRSVGTNRLDAPSVWREAALVTPGTGRRAISTTRWKSASEHLQQRLGVARSAPIAPAQRLSVFESNAWCLNDSQIQLAGGPESVVNCQFMVLAPGAGEAEISLNQLLASEAAPTDTVTLTGFESPIPGAASWLASWGTAVEWSFDWNVLRQVCTEVTLQRYISALAVTGVVVQHRDSPANETSVDQLDRWNVTAAGVCLNETGRAWCDGQLRTWSERVFAIGAAAGFPGWGPMAADPATTVLAAMTGQPCPVVILELGGQPGLAIAQRTEPAALRSQSVLWESPVQAGHSSIVVCGNEQTGQVSSIEMIDPLASERLRPLSTVLKRGCTVAELLETGRRWPSLFGSVRPSAI